MSHLGTAGLHAPPGQVQANTSRDTPHPSPAGVQVGDQGWKLETNGWPKTLESGLIAMSSKTSYNWTIVCMTAPHSTSIGS